jgi:formylglycine-generating enzyme required for sulfatase activity
MAARILDLKKKRRFGRREIIVIVISVILTTIGIKAADNLGNQKAGLQKKSAGEKCPSDMVYVPSDRGGFCMDMYENSSGPECDNPNPNNQEETKANIDRSNCRPVSLSGKSPWRNISQNQAAIACAKAGKRLPTNKEWQQAALGTPDKSTDWTGDDCLVANNWGQTPGLTGTGKDCISAAGAYDMIGNIWEWVDGTINNGLYEGNKLPDEGYVKNVDAEGMPGETSAEATDENYNKDYFWIKNNGVRGIARGGYYGNREQAGQFSAYLVSPPSFVGEGVGFRCVK